jgi:hypothetical protein
MVQAKERECVSKEEEFGQVHDARLHWPICCFS